MRRASLPTRLDRLAGRRSAGDLGCTVAELAATYGLDQAEVRAELGEITDRVRRFGPCTAEQAIARCAEELGLPEAELWAEYDHISGPSGDRA